MIREVMYRLRQGFAALFAILKPVDYDAAQAVLGDRLMVLFRRMTHSEQHHGLRVMHRLVAAGHGDDRDLLVAGLLHDVGKSRYGMNLFGRTVVVLAEGFMPEKAVRWQKGQPYGWRRPFVIKAEHPRWSAEDMRAAGSSSRAAALARWHQRDAAEAPKGIRVALIALQAADDG